MTDLANMMGRETRPGDAMRRHLEHAAWIAAFLLLFAIFINQIVGATRAQYAAAKAAERSAGQGMPWVCPIAGQCGPPGTPGLGRW
jgi:hypothetical protein